MDNKDFNDSIKVTVIGGGHQGLAMTAHLSLNNVDCYLWNRTERNIRDVIENGEIFCRGIVSGTAYVKKASANIEDCLQKLIMVTTPSNSHRDIAKLLAPYVDESYVIILNPGRTFGAREFVSVLKNNGCESLPVVAETQTIIYTCRRNDRNTVSIYALKDGVPIATRDKKDMKKVLKVLPKCIKEHFKPVDSDIITSMGNVGMILHCAPVLMNIGWIESKTVDFKYYYEGISPTIASLLERLDEERVMVTKEMGFEIESLEEWLVRTYKTHGDNLFECLQNNKYYKDIDAPLSINHRYIEEDVPNGLVPLESLGEMYGVPTPMTTLIIDLANAIMKKNYRAEGRKYIK